MSTGPTIWPPDRGVHAASGYNISSSYMNCYALPHRTVKRHECRAPGEPLTQVETYATASTARRTEARRADQTTKPLKITWLINFSYNQNAEIC